MIHTFLPGAGRGAEVGRGPVMPFFILAATQWAKATYGDPAGTEDQSSQLAAAGTCVRVEAPGRFSPAGLAVHAVMTARALSAAATTASRR
ncbi:hypothetical protein GCM10023334_046190 [Nonomuraea thailandensis]